MASLFAIRMAAHHVRNSGIIIYPTETVYGLGCNPDNFNAVHNLTRLKQRDSHSRFLLLASNIEQLSRYIKKPSQQELERINTADTPTSWITKAGKYTPPWLVTSNGTIGFRITKHIETSALCEQLQHPIISTSANLKGKAPVTSTLQCHQLFTGFIDYLLISNLKKSNTPSAIRDLHTGHQLR